LSPLLLGKEQAILGLRKASVKLTGDYGRRERGPLVFEIIMTEIQKVKKLRELTGCSIFDCRAALTEAEGDINKAVRILFNNSRKNDRWRF